MSSQDKVLVRTAADLEKKYNFAKLLGLSQNIETNSKELINIKNELTNMINALVINLGDILDSQSDISLWFYPHIPTTSNLPYTSWVTPSDHIGDLHYAQDYGYVYKYTSNGWVQQTDEGLVQAMATTNADIDTSDHERKVFITQPVPPYESGDWWILSDGTLKICQIGKATGDFDNQDFVIGNKYTPTIATQDGDIITIRQGQVIKMSDTFASFTDLATGGNTTIAGENITTGNIKSANYSPGVSGTNINLTDGKISTKNVSIDDDGLKLSNGAKVVGSNGLKNTYVFNDKNNGAFCGIEAAGYMQSDNTARGVTVDIAIPKGLEITSAKLNLFHNPVFWSLYSDPSTYIGYARALKIYKATNINSRMIGAYYGSEMYSEDNTNYSNVGVTWYTSSGTSIGSSYTPSTPTQASHNMEKVVSSDFSSMFKSGGITVPGMYQVKVETSESISQSWTEAECCQRTGWIYAVVEIEGYMTYS